MLLLVCEHKLLTKLCEHDSNKCIIKDITKKISFVIYSSSRTVTLDNDEYIYILWGRQNITMQGWISNQQEGSKGN